MKEPGFHSKSSEKSQDEVSFGPAGTGAPSTKLFRKAPLVLLLVFGALLYMVAQIASE